MVTCTRRLEFDYGHRLLNHESKCAHLHGHRGVVEITCTAPELDIAGRVIDFGEVKRVVGGWIDRELDHACLVNAADAVLLNFLRDQGQRHFVMETEVSAENIAAFLLKMSRALLPIDLQVVSVKFYETPNGWAEAR